MMHLLTVLSLSQGCVSLGKVSSKILDGVFCNFSFYFLNALITWFVLDPRTINFCTDHEKCCHFVFIQHIQLDRNFPNWLIIHINRCNSPMLNGGSIFVIVWTFSGLAKIPSLSMICLKNFSDSFENSHSLGLRISLA